MNIIKTSEKVLVWMHRTGKTQIEVSEALGKSRQLLARTLKDNTFTVSDLMNLKRLGYKE